MKIRMSIAVVVVCLMTFALLPACTGSNDPSAAGSLDTATTSAEGGNQDSSQGSAAEGLWDLGIDTVTLTNTPITEEDFKAYDLIVMNVWATWCPPCIGELPYLQEASEYFKDKNILIVGVLDDGVTETGVADESVIESAKVLLSDAGASYTVILPDETIKTQLINTMQYYPTTFFINSKGEVISTEVGAHDAEGWKELINEVFLDSTK